MSAYGIISHAALNHVIMWRNPYGQVTEIIGIELTFAHSWPRGARYFCLDTKVPKKSSQQGGFFALSQPRSHRLDFALQTGQNRGLQLFCPASRPLPNASAKTCYALSSAQGHHCSARFHPKLTC